MIKGSRELIQAAKEAMERDMQRCIERGNQPSFYEMFYDGYAQGICDMKEYMTDKAKEWLKENVNNYLYNSGGKGEFIPTCGDMLFEDFEKAMM